MDALTKHCQEVVNPTWNYAGRCEEFKDEVLNAALGVAGEGGEVADVIKKTFFHEDKNRKEELKLELGDLLYYTSKLMSLYGFTLDEVLEGNKAKLFERYKIGQ
jgi:NTP pyrophosphatase (non-canonical NTP hydrolase)